MKKIYIATLLIVFQVGALFAQTHFTPAFEGNGYDHMNIYIVESMIEGMDMQAGDEIAVFDGDICAGVFVLSEPLVEGTLGFINASKADSLTAGNGYIDGNTMSFKLWDASELTEYDNVDITFLDEETGQEVAPVPFTVGASVFVRLNGYSKEKDIGNTDVYSLTSQATTRRAIPVTFTEDGVISSISVYHNGGTGDLLLGVYSDASGFPGTRLGLTASTAVSSTEGWQEVLLISPVLVSMGETIWLAVVSSESGISMRYEVGTPGRAMTSYSWYSGLPIDFGTSSVASYNYSMYCTYSKDTTSIPKEKDIGNTDVYSLTSQATTRRAIPVTFTEDGVISSISVYHNGGTGDLLLGVYSDASGFPGTRLGLTASTAVSSTEGWQEVLLISPVLVSMGETIWLAVVSSESGISMRYEVGTPGRAMTSYSWYSGLPIDFGTSSVASYNYSMYCTYTTDTTITPKSIRKQKEIVVQEFSLDELNSSQISDMKIKVYPNPFVDKLKIEFRREPDERLQLSVYDIQGRVLLQMENELTEGHNQVVWNRIDSMGNRIKSGIYLVQLRSDRRREVFKVVCQGD